MKNLFFLLITSFFVFLSLQVSAQVDDIISANSEDIGEFDKILSRQPLPPDSQRILDRIQRTGEKLDPNKLLPPESGPDQPRRAGQEGQSSGQLGKLGQSGGQEPGERARTQAKGARDGVSLRSQFERRGNDQVRQRPALPPPQFDIRNRPPPLGPERERGRRRQPPPPDGGGDGGDPERLPPPPP